MLFMCSYRTTFLTYVLINLLQLMLKISFIKLNTSTGHVKYIHTHTKNLDNHIFVANYHFPQTNWNTTTILTNSILVFFYQDLHTHARAHTYKHTHKTTPLIIILCIGYTSKFTCFLFRNENSVHFVWSQFNSSCVLLIWSHAIYSISFTLLLLRWFLFV